MPKSVPITKRFPGRWCHRTRIWYPEGKFRGSQHASVQTEGGLHPDVGEFLLQLHLHGDHVDESMLEQLRSITGQIRQSVERTRKVREVMEE